MAPIELPRRQRLPRGRLLRLLDELDAAADTALSIYVRPGERLAQSVQTAIEFADLAEAAPSLDSIVASSATGAALFWGEARRLLVLPPFPLKQSLSTKGYHTGPLRSLLQADYTVALVLLRLGPYAIGVFKGDELLTSKVGARYVHGRHRQGGSSQRRFERGREKQMERLFDEACAVARQRLEPYAGQIDYLLYGGERHTLLAFRQRCAYLSQFRDRTLERTLNIPRPRQATLEAAIRDAWCSEVFLWE